MNSHLLPKWLKVLEKILEPVLAAEQLVSMQSITGNEDEN